MSSPAFLSWQDLTVVLPGSGASSPSRKLIHGLTGYAAPGKLLAIMGPSGSGKSTLLDSLAGRLSSRVVLTGQVLLNGKKARLDYGGAAYVTQEDVLLGTLTVRETITYSARLRLPRSLTSGEIRGVAEAAIGEMGLHDCADRPVGNWHLRGISGGERKRLSVALEALTRPRLLFLDEPTSGLDSAAAFFVLLAIRQLAAEGCRTVVASVHQPSSEVFALFDHLCLLSAGETVFFGEAKLATQFFAEVGFPCPSRRNPSDHFLRCINSDFDAVHATMKGSMKLRSRLNADSSSSSNIDDPLSKLTTSEIKAILIDRYKSSEYAAAVRSKIAETASSSASPAIEVSPSALPAAATASWTQQLWTLTARSLKNMSRDFGYYWLRLVIYIVVAVCVGSIYFHMGTASPTAIMARASCGAFVAGFMTFMSIGGFPSFIEEMKMFTRERRNGHYGVAVYIASNFLSSLPFLFAISLATAVVVYNMVGYHKGFDRFAYYTVSLYAGISIVESLMMIVAAFVPNYLMGIITGAGIIGIMMMTSGFFRLLPDLPKPIWRYPVTYITYGSWALQGNYKNDMLGLEFQPMWPGEKGPLTGAYVIQKYFGMDLHSKWLDLAVVFVILIAYRLLFFLVLKLRESGGPVVRAAYSKLVERRLKRRASFRRKPSAVGGSKRHPPPPMALQEGLSSPLPY